MWKSKADKPTMSKMALHFTVDLEVDSYLSDKELPSEITKRVKEKLCDVVGASVTRVERDGSGAILCLSVDFFNRLGEER